MFEFLSKAYDSAKSTVGGFFGGDTAPQPAVHAPAPTPTPAPTSSATATPAAPTTATHAPTPASPATDHASTAAPAPGQQSGQAPAAEPAPDPKAMSAAAGQLFKAMDGWGTDEAAIHKVLKGKSPAEIAAIKAAYADHYPGRTLDGDLADELSGDDLKQAQAAMKGDQVGTAALALKQAASGWGTDEAAIHETLRTVKPEDRAKLAAEYQKLTGNSLDSMLKDELSGSDLKQAEAEAKGDIRGADAAKIDDALHGGLFGGGGFLGTGLGRDNESVYTSIENCKDEKERKELAAAYEKQTGKPLSDTLNVDMKGGERDVATSLLAGDKNAAAAARIQVAADGLGTDEDAIFRQLEGKSGPDREAIIKAYNEKYGAGKGGKDFNDMLHDELGEMDEERAKQLAKNGKLDPSFALKYAMDGLGTDEAMIRKTLDGKSKEEVEAIKAAYKAQYNRDLDADIKDEVSGRDGFEIGQMMLGEPKTPEEKLARANAAYDFERGSGAGLFGKGVTDLFSDSGKYLDIQHQRMNELGDRIKDGKATPEDLARLDTVAGYQKQDVENYQAARDSVTNAAAMAGTAVVGTAVTILTAGAAAPATAAALAALAGGATGMAIKAGMQGASYSNEDIAVDAVTTLASAATAGLVQGSAMQGFVNGVVGLGEGQVATLGQTVVMEAIKGGAGGLGNGVVSGLLDENTWRGPGNGLLNFVEKVGVSTAGGAASGAASAGVTGMLPKEMEGVDPRLWGFVTGGTGGLAGGVAQTALDPGTYSGNWEDIATKFAVSAGTNALQSGAQSAHQASHEMALKAAAQQSGAQEATPMLPTLKESGSHTSPQAPESTVTTPVHETPTTPVHEAPTTPVHEAVPVVPVQEALPAPVVHEPAPTPQELAAAQQAKANQRREASITPEQREHFDVIDQLKQDAKTHSDWEYIRQLEHEANRPVSERTSAHDDQATLDALGAQNPGMRDGKPISAEEHAAVVKQLQDELDPQLAARKDDHKGAVKELKQEIDQRIDDRDANTLGKIKEQLADSSQTRVDENGVKHIDIDGSASVGMGGAGATGAEAAGGKRIGIEDATKPELWQSLGDKEAGQEANAISYGKRGGNENGINTADVAEHGTAQPAKASELALQVAARRDASEVGTLRSEGAVGDLTFTPHGDRYDIGIPVQVPGEGTVIMHVKEGSVDITSGMGPARQLRESQLSAENKQALGNKIMSGEQALAQPATDFAGKEVLGIGGGPTSIWAMEHAVNGGASSVEVAGAAPKPSSHTEEGKHLQRVEGEIRQLVMEGKPVPAELTEEHHKIIGDHVKSQSAELARIEEQLAAGGLDPRAQEKAQQTRDRLRAELDPFLGSRVDRNEGSLNDTRIKQVQADVLLVEPITETGADGQSRERVKVVYADGTQRVVDQVIPSIGADPNAPGGINRMLRAMPEGMTMEPVIAGGRVVGLASNPPGITVSGAAMVGTLGTNMPAELLLRIPEGMRDAVLSSIIDHANRDGVSAGSKGIVPGIENVGENAALMQDVLKLPPEQRQEALDKFLQQHADLRAADFNGENRFNNRVLNPDRPQYD